MMGPNATPLQKGLLDLAERAFFLFGLLLLSRSLAFLFKDLEAIGAYSIAEATEGNRSFQLVMGVVYLISAAYLTLHWQELIWLVRRNWAFFSFVGLVLASILWSDAAGLSTRRAVALLGNTLFATHLVLRLPRDEMLELAGMAMLGLLAINVFIIAGFPEVGIDFRRGGSLRGILGHKNEFGVILVIAGLVFWNLRRRAGVKGVVYLMACPIALVLAFLSDSRSTWAVALVVMICVPIALVILQGRRIALSLRWSYILIGGGAAVSIIWMTYEALLNAVGKDVTLTDRTLIWEIIFGFIAQRPWLGYGYDSFYQSEVGLLFSQMWAEIGHAHNGYLDLWLDLGLVGLGLFLFVIFGLILRLIREQTRYYGPNTTFFVQFLAMVLVLNSVAQAVPVHSTLMWTFFSLACLYTSLPYPTLFRRPGTEEGADPLDLRASDDPAGR